jgi:hypothetical protein
MDSKRGDPPRIILFSSQGYEADQTKRMEKRIQSEITEDYLVWQPRVTHKERPREKGWSRARPEKGWR